MINLTYSSLKTVDYNDVVLNTVEQTGEAVLTGALNCMSERKRLYMEFEVDFVYDGDQLLLPGSSIWVNFALFAPIGFAYNEPSGPPNTGFNFIIPEAAMPVSEMFFYANGAIEPDTCKNYRCWFELLSETTFSIELEFYNTYDENGYLNSTAKNNEYRFLSEMWNEQNFNEIAASVYQQSKQIRITTYIKHATAGEGETVPYSEKQETVIYQGESKSYNAISTFKPSIDPEDDDLAYLNSNKDTAVFATLACAADTLDDFYAKLIRIRNDGTLDFVENYELSENKIEAGNLDASGIQGPFTVSWNGSDGYDLSFDVNKDYIEDGGKYRIIVMGYGGGDARLSVSGVMSGTGIIPYCEGNCEAYIEEVSVLFFTAGLKDLTKDWNGNELTCSIEERLRTYLTVDYSDDRWKNNLACRGIACGRTAINDNEIRRYLKTITCDIYSEYNDTNLGGTVLNLLDRQVMQRTGVNTYYSPNIVFSFAADVLSLHYDFRVRNENNLDCIQTLLNGVNYYPRQMTQYWAVTPVSAGGPADLFIKWRLTFEYHDCNPVWQDHVDIIQKLHVRDYQQVSINGDTQICTNSDNCFVANIPFANPDTYRLINTIEKLPVHGGLEESENFVPSQLAQQTSTKFVSQDALYDLAGDADFCVDVAELEEGQTYSITAMAKKLFP